MLPKSLSQKEKNRLAAEAALEYANAQILKSPSRIGRGIETPKEEQRLRREKSKSPVVRTTSTEYYSTPEFDHAFIVVGRKQDCHPFHHHACPLKPRSRSR